MILELIEPDKIMKVKSCTRELDRAQLSGILNENMRHYNGVGLSANQLGIFERAFVMVSNMETDETIVCFNPQITKCYKNMDLMEEGCLSFPDVNLNVIRYCSIIVKYEDECKKVHKKKLTGFPARIFQHEYDHMEGINFTQRSYDSVQ